MNKRFSDSSSGPLGLFYALVAALGIVSAGVLSLPGEAFAAVSACEEPAALQQRLDNFDERWNASDAWGLTAQFSVDATLGSSGPAGREAVYRALIERLGRPSPPRQTRVLRASAVGQACLVDVSVRHGERSEAGVFVLVRDAGIVALR